MLIKSLNCALVNLCLSIHNSQSANDVAQGLEKNPNKTPSIFGTSLYKVGYTFSPSLVDHL